MSATALPSAEWCPVIPHDRCRTVPYGLVLAVIPMIAFPLGFLLGVLVAHATI